MSLIRPNGLNSVTSLRDLKSLTWVWVVRVSHTLEYQASGVTRVSHVLKVSQVSQITQGSGVSGLPLVSIVEQVSGLLPVPQVSQAS